MAIGNVRTSTFSITAILALACALHCDSAHAVTHSWINQFARTGVDAALGLDVDSVGNYLVSGRVRAVFPGPHTPNDDIYITKFDSTAQQQWISGWLSAGNDSAVTLALDSADNIFVGGDTTGNFGGLYQGGTSDLFVMKTNPSGSTMWSRQLGTTGDDRLKSLAVDGAGNSYFIGHTTGALGGPSSGNHDVLMGKYSAAGDLQWLKQFGGSGTDLGWAIDVDAAGNSYVTGSATADLGAGYSGNGDAFLRKYDPAGNVVWTNRLGSVGNEMGRAIAVDHDGSIWMAGSAAGSLPGATGSGYLFVSKFSPDGVKQWADVFGYASDFWHDIALDGLGNAYIVGEAQSSIGGYNFGINDMLLAKYDSQGSRQWTYSKGTSKADIAYQAVITTPGRVEVAGFTADIMDPSGWLPVGGDGDSVLLQFTEFTGDFNHDGVINAADLEKWKQDRGVSGGSDADYDGDSDGSDFLLWQRRLGRFEGQADTRAVPEPASLLLALLSVLSLRRRREPSAARSSAPGSAGGLAS
jgi:hypothetical protein